MQVLVNSNNSVELKQKTIEWAQAEVQDTLERFSGIITRIELHINDTNGAKEGQDDKYCSVEAHIPGRSAVAATHKAESIDLALTGALEKLDRILDKTLGRLQQKKGRTPMGGQPFVNLNLDESEVGLI